MTRELTQTELTAAHSICYSRSRHSVVHDRRKDHVFISDGCSTCRADIVRLVDGTGTEYLPPHESFTPPRQPVVVDASPSETTGGEVELRRSLDNAVNGAIDAHGDGIAALRLDRLLAAVRAAPHAGDGVPEVTSDMVEFMREYYNGAVTQHADQMFSRILAVLEACAKRQPKSPCPCGGDPDHTPDCPLVVALAKTVAHERALDAEERGARNA